MRSSLTRREALYTFGTMGMAGLLAACSNRDDETSSDVEVEDAATDEVFPDEDVIVRVASLKGPTTIGLVQMMDTTSGIPTGEEKIPAEAEEGSGITYAYTISAAPDEILPMIIQGTADIACVPSNVGSVLYNKTSGGVQVVDINTLGVLSVVTGAKVSTFADLSGKTVYISGKGSSPEYVLNFLLDQAGIFASVEVEWKSEHAEVAAELASDPTKVGILPQPFTTATLAQNEELSAPIDLTDVWNEYVQDGSQFVQGVTIVRTEFAESHPAAVADFVARHAASVEAVNDDPAAAAELVVQAGIIEKAPIAEKAIPECNVVCITGDEMHDALSGYLQVLYDADPSSVGGNMPSDDFYLSV